MIAPVAARPACSVLEAAPVLGLTETAVHRLIAAGFIDAWSDEVDLVTQVRRLADREILDARDVEVPLLVVHPGPVRPNSDFAWRRWVGVDVAGRFDLSEYDRILAFSTGWEMSRRDASALVGGIVAADVAGFLDGDHALRVEGFDEVMGRRGRRQVRLFGTPLSDAEKSFLSSSRITSMRDENGTWDWFQAA